MLSNVSVFVVVVCLILFVLFLFLFCFVLFFFSLCFSHVERTAKNCLGAVQPPK